ncbi:MAG TPA: protein kinase [Anaerolineales bacterium]|nr:protein kinase [Anaerolineales bacterium]
MTEPTILSNRYRLEDRLGTGGMAMVYRAHDSMLERTVAIKLLRADFARDPGFRARFREEAKAAANLSHPNIVTVHDFGLDGDQVFIVMEYVPGTDLKSLIRQRGHFTLHETLDLHLQACDGIGYAHRVGLVHCDVKPQNMLITPDYRLKVVDFGIARALASISPDEKAEVVWGSPQYFSPEQAAGRAPSPASDVYSLGVVLYEMLTGSLPFSDPSAEELARLHRESLPPSPRRLNPAIPLELERIVLKTLAKEPAQRYRNADQLGRVLRSFRETLHNHQAPFSDYAQPGAPLVGAENLPVEAAPARVPPAGPAPSRPLTSPARDSIRPAGTVSLSDDWSTWLIGLLALILVGGLIPFCLWVFYILNPPL